MGGILSYVVEWMSGTSTKVHVLPEELGDDADVADQDSGLTPREVAYIRNSWALVKPDLRSHGIKFFLLFFETHPHLMKKFKAFEGLSLQDLISNKKLAAHGTTVFTAIDSYVENLDDVSVVLEMLKTTGINHQNRGITMEDFGLLPPVLVQYLGEALGPVLSEGGKAAWVHLLNVIASVIGSTYE